jgi:hypothetical protein
MDFVPPPQEEQPTENIAGHDVREVSHEELMRDHMRETGGAPLWGGSMEPNHQAVEQARRAQQMGVLDDEVSQLEPDWMKARRQAAPQPPEASPAPRDTTQPNMPEVDMGDLQSVSDAVRVLSQQAAQAQADGNLMGARSLATASDLQRKYESHEEHPVLSKLKSTLGLKKIEPVTQPWAGINWNCYPSNVVLDSWLFDNMWDDRKNFAPLKVATTCVGLDGVPLYKVFSIPLMHVYKTVTEEGDIKEVPLKPYRKYCKSCGFEIEDLESEECKNCGSSVDPFQVPLPLRLFCAEKLYQFFQEEFGPTEKLDVLVGLLRDKVKDRLVDGEELFPLAMLSIEAPKMDGSPSGEDQSPERESSPQTPEQ